MSVIRARTGSSGCGNPTFKPVRRAGRSRHARGLRIAEICMPWNLRWLFIYLKDLRYFLALCRRERFRGVTGGSEVGENWPSASTLDFPFASMPHSPQKETRKDRQSSGRNTWRAARCGARHEPPGGRWLRRSCRPRRGGPPLHDTRRGSGGRRNRCPGTPDGRTKPTQTAQSPARLRYIPFPLPPAFASHKPQAEHTEEVGWPGQLVVRAAKPQEAHQKARYSLYAGFIPGPLVASRPGQRVVRATLVITTQIVRLLAEPDKFGLT